MNTKNTAINTAKNTARRGADPIRFRGLTLAWSGVDSRPIRRWRGLFAALLVVLGAAVAAPEARAAVLVSNLGQEADDTGGITRIAQPFRTGDHAAGYTLTSIVLDCECSVDNAGTVTLHSGTRTGTKVADFTGSPNADEQLVLTPTTAITLSADTTYVIVTANDFISSGTTWYTAADNALDSTSAAGWSIPAGYEVYQTGTMMWVTSTSSKQFRVDGEAITAANNVPVVANPIPDQTAPVGGMFTYRVPSNTFSDADTDTLSYAATKADGMELPTWLTFYPAAETLQGTPAASDVGIVSVKVTASDGKGGSVSDEFDITVEEDTTPPTLISATVPSHGANIFFVFTEFVSGGGSIRPLDSAFTVTADGIALAARGASVVGALALSVSPRIRQGQVVVITYTDSTTGDDANAIQDSTGNDAASFTTGMSGVPAVTNNSTRAAVAPDAPTGLTATASGTTTINLSWTAPVDNGGSVITGYKIKVSTDSGSTWTDQVANTASTTTTYEHTGLAASTTRHYRVSAINSIGTGTTPSDVVDATTGTAAAVTPTGNLLVSNLGQMADDTVDMELNSQAFTTGAHAAGYTLTSIVLGCDCGAYTTGTVTLHSGTRTGTKVADFTGSPNAANQLVLTPTMATTLSADTTYVIVTSDNFNISDAFWYSTAAGAEDSGSAAGWSIADNVVLYRTLEAMWVSAPGPLTIRVGGNAITSTNNPPTVANPIPDQTATKGAAFSYQFPDTTFNDTDSGDTLSYTATKADGTDLPTWLGFDAATRTFAGTPAATDVTVAVKVTATDTNSGSVSDEFNIEVRAANVLHCNPSDPYEVFCATLTVASNTSATDYGFAIGNYGSLSPDRFTYNGVNHRIGALNYSGSQLYFTTQQNDDSFATGFKLILDSVELSLDGAWDSDKAEYVVNNHGLSWSDNDTVQVKLVRLIPFSEKGPELVAPPRGTEGWLQVRWGERAGATGVQAYNVEWRTVIREDEAYRFQRVDKSAREHHLYNLKSGTEYEVRVCELNSPNFDRGVCSRYSRIQMPSAQPPPSNEDVKVSIEFPEGGATKRLSASDTVIRWRYRVTGIHKSGPEVFPSSAHGVAAGRVALQYRDETRQITVYGTASFGAPAPSSRTWMTWASEWTGSYLTESAPAM